MSIFEKLFCKKQVVVKEPLKKGDFEVVDIVHVRIGDNVKALGTITDKTFLPFSKVWQIYGNGKLYLMDKGTEVYREVL